MNREELFDKYLQRSLTPQEAAELKALLKDSPRAGRELVDYVNETSLIVRVGSQLQSVSSVVAESAVSEPQKLVRLAWVRPGVWLRWAALAACFVALAYLMSFFRRGGDAPVLQAVSLWGEVVLQRGHGETPVEPGMGIKPGDTIRTGVDAAVSLRYANEATEVEVHGETTLRVVKIEKGKRLELQRGTVEASVAPQPKDQPMMLVTPQAEAKVLGTQFILASRPSATLIEVIEGAVQLTQRGDGKSIQVKSGFIATASPKTELTARPMLAPPWRSQDIGAVGLKGCAKTDDNGILIRASGRDRCLTKDELHFVYQPLEGDGEIRARIVGLEFTDEQAKAGVMIRQNLKASSPQASVCVLAEGGVEFERRHKGDGCVERSGAEVPPCWLRLVRRGDLFIAYKSTDAKRWIEIGSDIIHMDRRVYFGLGATSFDNGLLSNSAFDNVSVIPNAANNTASNKD